MDAVKFIEERNRMCGGATTAHYGFCWAAHPSPTGCRCRMRRR